MEMEPTDNWHKKVFWEKAAWIKRDQNYERKLDYLQLNMEKWEKMADKSVIYLLYLKLTFCLCWILRVNIAEMVMIHNNILPTNVCQRLALELLPETRVWCGGGCSCMAIGHCLLSSTFMPLYFVQSPVLDIIENWRSYFAVSVISSKKIEQGKEVRQFLFSLKCSKGSHRLKKNWI